MESQSLSPLFQDEAWRTLQQMCAAGPSALPSSLIFTGPEGVGKKHAAKALFQKMSCEARGEEACGRCESCVRVARGQHVDLFQISPKGQQILVEDLREALRGNAFRPYDGSVRMILIDDAHRLNTSAANALLKSLEEPAPYVKFILVTHERGRLLPTIASRCQFVHFRPLGAEAILKLAELAHIEIPQGMSSAVLELSGGGVAKLALFSAPATLECLNKVRQWLSAASRPRDWQGVAQVADELAAFSDDHWALAFAMAVHEARKAALEEAQRGRPDHAYQWSDRALRLLSLARSAEHNANRKLVALKFSEYCASL